MTKIISGVGRISDSASAKLGTLGGCAIAYPLYVLVKFRVADLHVHDEKLFQSFFVVYKS